MWQAHILLLAVPMGRHTWDSGFQTLAALASINATTTTTTTTTTDWVLWKEQRLAALKEASHAFNSKLAEWEDIPEERWHARLSIPNACQYLAFLDGKAVGMIGGLLDDQPEVVELVSLWVTSTARGRGVGDALIAAVEEWARDIGATQLKLEMVMGSKPARSLYFRNGFVDVDFGNDELVPRFDLVMFKQLR